MAHDGRTRVAVLGAGGLGKAAARIIGLKQELRLTAICDSQGLVACEQGLETSAFASISGDLVEGYRQLEASGGSTGGVAVAEAAEARHTDDPIGEVIAMAPALDAVLIALPNLPNEFIPGVIRRFAESRAPLVFVDVLK